MQQNYWHSYLFDTTIPFKERALRVFSFQYNHNPLYQEFCDSLYRTPQTVSELIDIPFLPVEFFKTHRIITEKYRHERIFRSSGTTGQQTSQHVVADCSLYNKAIKSGFELFFGPIDDYCILALLPSYLERNDASLVYMADYMMQESKHPYNGFFLYNYKELQARLTKLIDKGQEKIILLGVTFALLDFAEQFPQPLTNTFIIETGGMKGRRKEITRSQLHHILKKAFQVNQIYSEYGMTEMLSQAYFIDGKAFYPSPSMKVLIRDITDPFMYLEQGKTGGINIIDLANVYSCSFLATQDIGKCYEDGSFEVFGRTDYSDLRGCNLMVQ